MQSNSTYMEYKFIINSNRQFVMGENSALPCIDIARELNILTKN